MGHVFGLLCTVILASHSKEEIGIGVHLMLIFSRQSHNTLQREFYPTAYKASDLMYHGLHISSPTWTIQQIEHHPAAYT